MRRSVCLGKGWEGEGAWEENLFGWHGMFGAELDDGSGSLLMCIAVVRFGSVRGLVFLFRRLVGRESGLWSLGV